MYYNIITLPVTLFFIINGFGQLYYAIKLRKKFPNEHNFNNSVLIFFLWIIAGLLYPFFYSKYDSRIGWFQTLSTIFICIFTPFIIFLILYYQYIFVAKKNPNIKKIRNFDNFLNEFDKRNSEIKDFKTNNLNTDLHRKGLHLVPAGIIILLWIFAVYIWAGIWKADQIWDISGEDFGRFLILTVGFSGIFVFAALDYVRLSYIFEKRNLYHLLPDNVSDLLIKTIKRREAYEFTKPSVLVLAFVPIFFFPFGIFAAAALIATIGDGAASILGMRFGKGNFPKKSRKTIVGYIAGFLASMGVSFLAIRIFEPELMLIKILILSISGAIMFFIIDFLSLNVDDNILNPLFCAILMGVLYYLI